MAIKRIGGMPLRERGLRATESMQGDFSWAAVTKQMLDLNGTPSLKRVLL